MPIDFIKTHLYDGHIQKHNCTLFQDRYLTKKNEALYVYLQNLTCENIFGNWKPFKNDEKCFLFHVKSSLVL